MHSVVRPIADSNINLKAKKGQISYILKRINLLFFILYLLHSMSPSPSGGFLWTIYRSGGRFIPCTQSLHFHGVRLINIKLVESSTSFEVSSCILRKLVVTPGAGVYPPWPEA